LVLSKPLEILHVLLQVLLLNLVNIMLLNLLLHNNDLVNFVDKLFPEINLFEVFRIFPEYFEEKLNVSLALKLKCLLNNSRNGIVAVLVEHDVPEKIVLFQTCLFHKHVENHLLAFKVGVVHQDFHHT
jgi:hypothetical protein